MRAMILSKQGERLTLQDVPIPIPNSLEILIRIEACGVCRTDLHVLDGDLKYPKLPLIMGHQIVGKVEKMGDAVKNFHVDQRIGVPWLAGSCGQCEYCLNHQENLCDQAKYMGYQRDGGFAEYTTADARFCFPIPSHYATLEAAPLLCAGLIGYRAMSKIPDAKKIGFYGFGSSAHILTQLAVYQGKEIYAFTRSGDEKTQGFAKKLGAVWAGGSDTMMPNYLDAVIIFAPSGDLIPLALQNIKKGGTVVCAGIHMTDIPSFHYELLWGERRLCSVANLTRQDGEEFLKLAPLVPIHTEVTVYPLEKVNEALEDLRHGKFTGSAVIKI